MLGVMQERIVQRTEGGHRNAAVRAFENALLVQRIVARYRVASIWEDQEVIVRGKKMLLGLVEGGKLYHGSPNEIKPGTILQPGYAANYDQSSSEDVSITSDKSVAGHWGSLEGTTIGYIYEVEPLGEIDVWRVGPANGFKNIRLFEGRVKKARVLRLVGKST